MTKGFRSKIKYTLILTIILIPSAFSQDLTREPLRVMFYNVENLFDCYDDTLKNDDDFLPAGLMRWNSIRYNQKLNSIYKTIVAAGEWEPPSIIAFCEIENRKVIEDLVYGSYLSKYNFRIVHEDSPDQRGIDVCLIYKEKTIRVITYKYWIPSGIKRESFTSRSILYTKLFVCNDTIHLIVNHWPSRRGGVLAGEDLRMKISSMIREKTDSIMRSSKGGARIIIMGDFNSTPDGMEIRTLTAASGKFNYLTNLSEELAITGQGTYRYLGIWEMIDQVIVSDELLNCIHGLYTDLKMLRIFRSEFLLRKDPRYPGESPFSTYRGYRYQGGFSDHLPVLLDLKVR